VKVLGISANYHDASAALVVDGEVVFSAAEERFSRVKHDPTLPLAAARACLAQAGITAKDLNFVAYHEDPPTKLSRSLATSLARWPLSFGTFWRSAKEAITSGLWVKADLAQALGVPPSRVVYAPHHASHAAHAFLTSPFADAAVMTIDAVGEWTCSAIFDATHVDGRAQLRPVDVSPFPHSVGLFYSAFTSYLGFAVNDGECSAMALAAFGEPRFADQIREILTVDPEGRHRLVDGWFDFRGDKDLPVTDRLIRAMGPPRHFRAPLPWRSDGPPRTPPSAEDQRFADVAASVQQVCEEAVVAYARRARELTGKKNLCYAGGVALNCVANKHLLDAQVFEAVYVPPDPGDGGGAMGAALLVHDRASGSLSPHRIHPFLGSHEGHSDDLEGLLEHLEPEQWHRFSRHGLDRLEPDQLQVQVLNDPAERISAVIDALAKDQIVGWCQGRFENGPRALGGRSLLARADRLAVAERLSTRIKRRLAFRPYAPSLTEAEAKRCLVLQGVPDTARWMQLAIPVTEEGRTRLAATLHIDGTTRPQIVRPQEAPLYHRLLVAAGAAWGTEAVLNTSFNESGSPMVGSGIDALMAFARTDLDAVLIGPLWVRKVR
jgi:carbamoyltransferase